ncbi:sarcosine oxidase subunit gamma [Algicella marina]|uniref:Sarcosine oxidase subunit gamma n=1 Tax=Algicella marina TaxID=2683284 RepID=A0A6P1SXU6_9RHOB|nr:sarcosine oxidase subunit gamma family protein [Algicella marina]QHQ34460.1 sarcosine oxidase subunit gamma [Algicella marina]
MSEIVHVEKLGRRGMISMKGDLAEKLVAAVAEAATGMALPGPREIMLEDGRGLAWMAPDELLLLFPEEEVEQALTKMESSAGDQHILIAEVSDARTIFAVEGARAREVLAKLAPVDLSPEAFGQRQIRRTRLAQVAAAFWLVSETRFEVVCFRSVEDYVEGLLRLSAAPGTVPEFF